MEGARGQERHLEAVGGGAPYPERRNSPEIGKHFLRKTESKGG